MDHNSSLLLGNLSSSNPDLAAALRAAAASAGPNSNPPNTGTGSMSLSNNVGNSGLQRASSHPDAAAGGAPSSSSGVSGRPSGAYFSASEVEALLRQQRERQNSSSAGFTPQTGMASTSNSGDNLQEALAALLAKRDAENAAKTQAQAQLLMRAQAPSTATSSSTGDASALQELLLKTQGQQHQQHQEQPNNKFCLEQLIANEEASGPTTSNNAALLLAQAGASSGSGDGNSLLADLMNLAATQKKKIQEEQERNAAVQNRIAVLLMEQQKKKEEEELKKMRQEELQRIVPQNQNLAELLDMLNGTKPSASMPAPAPQPPQQSQAQLTQLQQAVAMLQKQRSQQQQQAHQETPKTTEQLLESMIRQQQQKTGPSDASTVGGMSNHSAFRQQHHATDASTVADMSMYSVAQTEVSTLAGMSTHSFAQRRFGATDASTIAGLTMNSAARIRPPLPVSSQGLRWEHNAAHSPACSSPEVVPSSQEPIVPQVVNINIEPEKKRRRGRSGSFPQKIHQMLRDLEDDGRQDIASFVRGGKAFCIHRTKEFAKDVMPKYFKMGSYASFQRQLNLYSFTRIGEGPDRGAYFHELFIEGKPLLSTTMKRKETKKPPLNPSSASSLSQLKDPPR